MKIDEKKVVSINYTLRDEKGSVLDSSEGEAPLVYLHGMGNLIPGLENALLGKSPGDSFKVSIPPAEGYGEFDQEKIMEVERSQFKGVDDLAVGMQFSTHDEMGEQIVTVTKIEKETVTVDGNHPLAGMTLNFDVSVVDVRDASAEELSHGHVHGPDGHHHH